MVIPAHQDEVVRLGLVVASSTCVGKTQRIGGTPYVSGKDSPSQGKTLGFVYLTMVNNNVEKAFCELYPKKTKSVT